ncbi:hypothetical protein [Sphingomonas sp. NIBR02145]|uniref:hypothetical protein n=1 Tax=Sphingomonas sp. NIBR02145 TaxID=3014784 RepID=UPI0022B40BE4|nr:hypothetical protein [Sphingomonas sp. NIBR02145]WHU04261.1 hypothetical protein O3305_06655 [Sphingomonas sp. NIBR02145]
MKVILDALWCGQGMAHMVRVFRDEAADPATTAADWLCLFDLGAGGLGESKKALGVTPPVHFIIEQLKMQQKAGRRPTIELLLISHQDNDHWSLLSELNERIIAEKLDVLVERMLACGTEWLESSEEGVQAFFNRARNWRWWQTMFSSFQIADRIEPVTWVGDMQVLMLVTNVASKDTGKVSKTTGKKMKLDIVRNCSSAMVMLQIGRYAFTLPGDATWETLGAFKNMMANWPQNPLAYSYATSVPHHGAYRTIYQGKRAGGLSNLIWFTDYTQPYQIFASAGFENTHKHPHEIILTTFGKFTEQVAQFEPHPLVVYTTKFMLRRDVKANKYTTVLNLTSPVQSCNWIFSLTPTTAGTGRQLFEAGIPGLLSAPALSEIDLHDQIDAVEEEEDEDVIDMVTQDMFAIRQEADFPIPRSPVQWFETPLPLGSPAQPQLRAADPEPRVHAPRPSAGNAAASSRRRAPTRRVRPD